MAALEETDAFLGEVFERVDDVVQSVYCSLSMSFAEEKKRSLHLIFVHVSFTQLILVIVFINILTTKILNNIVFHFLGIC